MVRTAHSDLQAYRIFQGQRYKPWNLGEMPNVCRELERQDSLGIRLVHSERRAPLSSLGGAGMSSLQQKLECSAEHLMAIIEAFVYTSTVPLEKGQTVELDIRDLVALTRQGSSFNVAPLISNLPQVLQLGAVVQAAKTLTLPPGSAIQFSQYGQTYDLRTAPFPTLLQILPVYLSKLPEKEEGRGLGTEITLQDLPGMLADLPTLMPEACGNIKLGDIIGKWVRANLAG